MVQEQNVGQTQPSFPTPTEAVSYGFRFLRDNIWFAIVFVGLAAAASGVAVVLVSRAANNDAGGGSWAITLIASVVLAFLAAMLRLVLIRRTLDYWDETEGRAQPRSFAEAVNTAVDGAGPRTLPYIGWSLLWAVVFVVAMAIGFAIAFAFNGVGLLIALLVVLVAALIVVLLANFFLVAAADGPGDPLGKSFHVFNGHVLRVVGTFLLYYLIALVVSVLVAIPVAIVGDSGTAESIANALGVVLGVLFGAAVVGSDAVMYRAVYPPASS